MNKLSIVGKDYHTEGRVTGYHNAADRMKVWGDLKKVLGRFVELADGLGFLFYCRHRSRHNVWPTGQLDC